MAIAPNRIWLMVEKNGSKTRTFLSSRTAAQGILEHFAEHEQARNQLYNAGPGWERWGLVEYRADGAANSKVEDLVITYLKTNVPIAPRVTFDPVSPSSWDRMRDSINRWKKEHTTALSNFLETL